MRQLQVHPSRAFTLVELLVVIGIIAILISMLLPALAKVREAGNRSVCLSNMRQLDQAIRLYGNDNKDQIPIGFAWGDQFNNYTLFNGTSNKYQLMGAAYQLGTIKEVTAFFCPNETDLRWTYNSPVNPWPPQPGTTLSTRVAYGTRPVVDWYTNDRPKNQAGKELNYFRYTKLRNVALIAEIMLPKTWTSGGTYIGPARRHKTGMNVAYADGSVRWVGVKSYEASYNARGNDTLWLSTVWKDFDKQ